MYLSVSVLFLLKRIFLKGNPEKKLQRQTEYKRSIFFYIGQN